MGRYTYVRDLKGPWLLYDNQTDPYQLKNLANDGEFSVIQGELDTRLQRKLGDMGDDFLPGMEYIGKWNYSVDDTGTVPYME